VLCEQADIPAGVVNMITGSAAEIGTELTTNPVVAKVTFTGSTEVGRTLLENCASTIKKTSMELGGNAPFLVFDDADIDAAIEGAMVAQFRNTGQTCVASNRFYVQDGVYEEFTAKLTERVAGLKLAYAMDDGAQVGPLIDRKAIDKVEEHLEDAKQSGARVLTGGHVSDKGGSYFEPTVIVDVKDGAIITREETFGPVAAVVRFATEADAIRMANDTPFGLAAYFYARDMSRI
jgi:succinate-semialdehyde dehydrogenase/glutarate-semialdehyde dehydrogenase